MPALAGSVPIMCSLTTGLAVTDGGLETTLLFHDGLELPCFAAFPLLEDERGRAALRRYFENFLRVAGERGLPFVIDTPTWRANPDWGAELGYDAERLAEANRAAVAFVREIAAGRDDVIVDGVLGPRGDGYVVGERMTADAAADYHAWQIGVLADAGVDRITALTMTYPEEAIGVVRAAAAAGVPVVPSFTVETDGRLPTAATWPRPSRASTRRRRARPSSSWSTARPRRTSRPASASTRRSRASAPCASTPRR
jgi:homocysteine S-methyltransferase